jgi:flagellar hook-associated protein 1
LSFNAIQIANSGLAATQAAIDVVAGNIANSGTAGYVRREATTIATVAGAGASSVKLGAITRALGPLAQRQLRLETAGAAYTARTASATGQLDSLFGTPGASSSLDGTVNAFATALQSLQAEPSSTSARAAVVTAAGTLATRLGTISTGVQALRTDAETRLDTDVGAASELLSQIAGLNAKAVASQGSDPSILDQRDAALDKLSAFMDIATTQVGDGTVTVSTGSGVTLVDHGTAARLSFDGRTALSANAQWSSDPAQRGVGTITATLPGGSTVDLVQTGAIRSGSIAANLELRDTTLVQAQRGLDELAGGLARAFSDSPAPVSATAGGFDIGLAGIQPGNAVTLDLTTSAGLPKRYVLVPTNGTTPATVDPKLTTDPTATVVTFDASGPATGYAARIAAALTGAGVTVSAPAGATAGTVRIVSDGTATASTVKTVSAGITATTLQGGAAQLPLFVDSGYANTAFTGSFQGGSHLTGLAQRLTVNPSVVADTSTLVAYKSGTLQNDTTRPDFLVSALTATNRVFGAGADIGGVEAPYTGSVQDFALRLVEKQAATAQTASDLDEGQQVALASAQSSFSKEAGVSIDSEMSNLVQLQTAYSANARVLAAARDMLDTLLRI